MAYCEREDCIHHKACYDVNGFPCRADFAHYNSKADFVPKSEVDWNSIPVDVSEALKQRAVEKAKAEVAREIFEEIEKLFFRNGVFIHIHSYNELKKKYTEDKG